jgi:hypothetical protein
VAGFAFDPARLMVPENFAHFTRVCRMDKGSDAIQNTR